jgi:protein subunit release factor B
MPSVGREKEKELEARMEGLGIYEEDLVEKFIRAGGKGGQKVNKTSSCVYLKHIPSGMEVKIQKDRSQAVNRFLARRLLCEKIEADRLGSESKQRQAIEKIRRQKRKRSKRAREKILKDKKIQSIKKELRSPPDWE